jgi:hypothetical protein
MTEDKVRKAEYPLNSQGLGYRSTLENGPYFLEDIGYKEPIENYRYQYCGACAFYTDSGCAAAEEDVHVLGSCSLYINMAMELDLRHQQFVLVNEGVQHETQVAMSKDKEKAEKYISEEGGQYCVRSHQTGKNFGCYSTHAAAEKRLKQIKRFKDQDFEVKFAGMDEDKRLVYGIVLEPNEVDYHEDTITADEIEKAAHGYANKPMVIGDGHVKRAKAYPVETFIYNPEVLENVKPGSWVMAIKVKSDTIWEGIKQGDYTGFSIGAMVKRTELPLDEEVEDNE